jgi:hypothetical protein
MPMNTKPFIAAFAVSLILISFSAELLIVKVANANPLPRGKPTNPPAIIIQSPLNSTYTQNDLQLNFSIPSISHWWPMAYHLTDVYYECDGKSVYLYEGSYNNTEQFFSNLTELTNGTHTLTVHANGAGLYYTQTSVTDTYFLESNQTVTFTVNKDTETNMTLPRFSPTASPSPTQPPSPSLTPSDSPTQQPTPTPTNPQNSGWTPYTIIGFAAVIIAVVVFALIKFKTKTRQGAGCE